MPYSWNYEDSIDPVILIRSITKYCTKNMERRDFVMKLLEEELNELKKSRPGRYKELMSNHERELSGLSGDGKFLVAIRLLTVIREFNISWLIDNNLIDTNNLEMVRMSSWPKRNLKGFRKNYF